MAFKKCYYKDCLTPRIYVSPIIPKTIIASSYTVEFDANVASFLEEVGRDKAKVDDAKSLVKTKIKTSKTLESLELPDTNMEGEFEDYIVIYCDSNHKNVIPIAMPKNETKEKEPSGQSENKNNTDE